MKILAYKHVNLLYFAGCFVVLFLIYFSAHRAMLIDDGISGIWEIKMQGMQGYLKSYGFENFYYGHYGIVALLYFLFGLHALGWYIFFVAMHALNATLIFVFCQKLFQHTLQLKQATILALCGSLLFLLSPYQSENIIWAATSHYSVTFSVLLTGLILLDKKISAKGQTPYFIFHLLFAFALVTLEISFLFPVIWTALFFLYKKLNKNEISFRVFFLKFLLPQIVLVFIYCLFHKIYFQTWIPHDRAGADTGFSLAHSITTLSQQMLKLFGFVHYLPHSAREAIYSSLLHWKKVLLVLILLSAGMSFWLYRKDLKTFYTALFLMGAALLMYLPFMRLYFMYLSRIENDRYNYFASAFLFLLLVYLLFQISRKLGYFIISAYLIAFIICLFPVVSARKHSAVLHHAYLAQLPVDNTADKIYLLNVPASCRDAYVFRAEGRTGIAYQTIYNKSIFEKIVQVAWYNAQSENDDFEAKKLSDSSYQVQIKTNGSWWMYQSIGASDMENDLFRFTLDQWGGYVLTFKKQPAPNDQILLYDQGKFVRLN
ncbi:MAG: hypothetical protein IT257_09640 [Chitinophagaceae bacterium]|nr:hypothetical protein [Chitinophagaceae bacterium]